jgi:hypothetical protein
MIGVTPPAVVTAVGVGVVGEAGSGIEKSRIPLIPP